MTAANDNGSTRLYVMESAGGFVKVGISGDPEKRRRSLQSAYPEPLILAYVSVPFPRRQAGEIERRTHAALARWRRGHEWFKCYAITAISAARREGAIHQADLEIAAGRK